MNPDYEKSKLFTRRALLLAGGQGAFMLALVGRMYYLQIVESKKYAMLAEENRINLRLLPPPRGRIVDRFGVPLAVNRQSYRVDIVAERTGKSTRERKRKVKETLAALSTIIPLSEADARRVLREIGRKRAFVPITVRKTLTWEEVARIEVNTPDLPGITIAEGTVRHYPLGQAGAHVLGYVAAVSEAEQTGDPLLELPDIRIGKNGIEKVFDAPLRGEAGTQQIEVNAHGRIIKELSREDAKPGQEVALTIDADLQRFIADRLGEESAIAVVMDVHGGQVMALSSNPGYDPTAFHDGLDPELWRAWRRDPKKPLISKAVAGQYAPGSVFKMCVALAALEAGIIGRYHRVSCYGHTQLGSSRFHCWKRGGHGTVDLHEAIKQSCDVFFYDVARRLGVDRLADMARRLGLGRSVGIDLHGERSGFIPTRAWKLATLGEPWQDGESLVAGIGQGFVLTTPLQLAVMMSRLVNGGKAVTPHIAHRLVTAEGLAPRPAPDFASIGVRPENLRILANAMNGVVNEPGGTARRGQLSEEGMSMGGKTGTSQVRRITREERARGVKKNEDLPWELRDHGLFVGYGPVEDPRYVVAVVLEHGGSSKYAVPIARDIMRETLSRDPLQPRPTGEAAAPAGARGT
ncbi:MAG: penicillin-binding protein 2 [Alphaproteobacteria bacterium]|nr:penicillin-binding protein 2 [Alphaproteobacteria bacterium]